MYCSCNEAVERGSQRKLSRTKQANKYLENITEKLIFNKRKGLVRDDIRICYQPSLVLPVRHFHRALWCVRPTSKPNACVSWPTDLTSLTVATLVANRESSNERSDGKEEKSRQNETPRGLTLDDRDYCHKSRHERSDDTAAEIQQLTTVLCFCPHLTYLQRTIPLWCVLYHI